MTRTLMLSLSALLRLRFHFARMPVLIMMALLVAAAAQGAPRAVFAPIPAEVSSDHFVVSIDGSTTRVVHAAGGYYLLNFEVSGPVQVTVTASDAHYWDAGVEVQPIRHGIRPTRKGASITFPLAGPAKLSITRPGDHFGDSEMLFLFANEPDRTGMTAKTPGIRYYGPGVHRENIDAHTGDRIYLAAGAVVFGALNIWQVDDVHVSGLGTIIYDGPQDPDHDEGWMHKPNWHAIVMDNAHHIEIEGITGIVRSRTWMVQMRDSRGIRFRNVKILGNTAGNANQDGLDWLGGGDTLVQDSFFRASDDIFAMYGNWDGYREDLLTMPGHEVSNITVENSVLSTSISNVVRVGWPKKTFDSHNFTLRNSDVLHMGAGGCVVPFALFELWADPGGKGQHTGFHFDNIRLEDWYSLVQVRHPNPSVRDVTFSNIWALDGPGMVPSMLKGDVAGVTMTGVEAGSGAVLKNSDVPLEMVGEAQEPVYQPGAMKIGFSYAPGLIRAGNEVAFKAEGSPGVRYQWYFGDGAMAEGSSVRHVFPDAEGTLLDGSGKFRVLLHGIDDAGHEAWSSRGVVVAKSLLPATKPAKAAAGLKATGNNQGAEGYLRVPADGGYTLTLLTSTTSSLVVDGVRVRGPKLRPQVCGAPGNAVQAVTLSLALARGLHSIQVERGAEIENAVAPNATSVQIQLLWEGPGFLRQNIPAEFLVHAESR